MRLSALGLILVLAILAVLLPPLAQPPRRVPTIGWLYRGFPPSEVQLRQSPLWQAVHELGWVEGQNITVERRYAEGHNERLRVVATELVQRPVDIILAVGPQEARAAKAASDTIPIVFMDWGDPVRAGAVASLAHPGGNMTGMSTVEFIPIKSLAAKGSGEHGSYAGHNRFPSPDREHPPSTNGSGPSRCDSASRCC